MVATKHADFGLRQFVKSGSMTTIEAVRRVLDARDFHGVPVNDKFLSWAERRIKREKIEKSRRKRKKDKLHVAEAPMLFENRSGEEE